jgi:hypothetical protein
MAVNVKWWNERFAVQARSIGLAEAEAERVLLRSPIGAVGARFEELLSEIAQVDPERSREIRRLMELKMKEELR